jgi:hypothetical protein
MVMDLDDGGHRRETCIEIRDLKAVGLNPTAVRASNRFDPRPRLPLYPTNCSDLCCNKHRIDYDRFAVIDRLLGRYTGNMITTVKES